MKRVLMLVAVGLLIVVSACHKTPPTSDPVWSFQATGDSVLFQAEFYGGGSGANTQGLVGLGWEAKHAQPRLDENVHIDGHSPAVLVMAFGQNYADVYGQAESDELFRMMFTPHDSACVVVVLPSMRQNMDRVRADLQTLAWARSGQGKPTRVVDWQTRVSAHPEYLDADGVHLSSTDANGNGRWDSSEAFLQMMSGGCS